MFGADKIFSALNVSPIVALVDTVDAQPAIYSGVMLPSNVPLGARSINFHRDSVAVLGAEYENYSYTINCRASTQNEAELMAQTVVATINRVTYNGYILICTLYPVIRPMDERDNYNAPVGVRIIIR